MSKYSFSIFSSPSEAVPAAAAAGKHRRSLLLMLLIAVLAVVLLLPAGVQAAENYRTTNYNVQVNVDKNNSAYITETIKLDISKPIHGITRTIPLSQKVNYTDRSGRVIRNVRMPVKIGTVTVINDPCTLSRSKGRQIVYIGGKKQKVSGQKTYSLSYEASMYDDGIADYDSFFYKVLPDDWPTAIEHTGITVTMPRKFDSRNVSVTAGRRGGTSYTKYLHWTVRGRTITITADRALPENVGVTVGVKLPEGYFTGERTTRWWKVLLCVLGVVFSLILVLLWYRFGRDRKVVETVEYVPPAGVGPADAGYIIDGRVDKKDVASLLFWFAQKGYLTIEEAGKKDYRIVKEHDLPQDEARQFERAFFDGLFAAGNGSEVLYSQLGDRFHHTFETTREKIHDYYTADRKRRIFPRAMFLSRIVGFILLVVGFAAAAVLFTMIYGSLLICLPTAGLCVLSCIACALGVRASDRRFAMRRTRKVTTAVISLIILGITMGLSVLLAHLFFGFFIGGLFLALLEVTAYFTIRFMQSRTKQGTELLGHLLGFREFIRVAEAEKLVELLEENPNYFYDVLPYAYVFGLSKKWAKKFEEIPTAPPAWYRGGEDWSAGHFNTWLFFPSFHALANATAARFELQAAASGGSSLHSFGSGGSAGSGQDAGDADGSADENGSAGEHDGSPEGDSGSGALPGEAGHPDDEGKA